MTTGGSHGVRDGAPSQPERQVSRASRRASEKRKGEGGLT